MKLKCLAIDDEPLALKQIGSYIEKTPFLELAGLCNSALAALDQLSESVIDVLFVDINMPDLSGMDFVKSLKERPFIVFTTAYSEYAIEGFKVDAADYLLKPFGYAEFLKAANKVRSIAELSTPKTAEAGPGKDHLFVKADYKVIRIELSEILYIESMHEYVRIHLDRDKPIMTLISLKALEEQLPADRFMRVHRSYIVNSEKIKIVERNRIVFDKVYIPVSEQYKNVFQTFLNRNILS